MARAPLSLREICAGIEVAECRSRLLTDGGLDGLDTRVLSRLVEDLGTNRDSDEYERALSALRASLFRDHPPSPAVPDPPPPVLVEEPEYVVVESPQPPTTPQRRPSLSDTLSSFSIGRLRRQRSLFVRLDAPAMGSSPRSPAPLTAPPAFESVPLSSPAEMPLSAAEAADAYVRLHDQLDRLRHLRGKAASDRELLVEHLQQVGAASAGAPQEGRASRSSSFIGRAAVEIFSMLPGALTARPQEAAASASTDGIEPLNSPLSLESLINRAASSTNLKQFEQSTFSAVEFVEQWRRYAHSRHELTEERWAEFVDADGIVVNAAQVLECIFYGGASQDVRPKLWNCLLGLEGFDMSAAQRAEKADERATAYARLRREWGCRLQPGTGEPAIDDADLTAILIGCKKRIDKDVVRTDSDTLFFAGSDNPNIAKMTAILLSYAVLRPVPGYVQGMSDLLAPILAVMEDECETFWCFTRVMDRMAMRFDHTQAFFKAAQNKIMGLLATLDPPLHALLAEHSAEQILCFRWLLLDFKRDFSFSEVLRLWEAMWTSYLTHDLHIFVALALLTHARDALLSETRGFDDILRITNGLSGNVPVETILESAENIFWRLSKVLF